MTDQFVMKRNQTITLNDKIVVDKLNNACDLMEELSGQRWSINKWLRKNAENKAKKG